MFVVISEERRLPWLGGIFGLITSLMLIAADESVATNKAILEVMYRCTD